MIKGKVKVLAMLLAVFNALAVFAQAPTKISYDDIQHSGPIHWSCPAVEKYLGIIDSELDKANDFKVCANRLKDQFPLYTSEANPANKLIATQAFFDIENPMFDSSNLLNHIYTWLKKKGEWAKDLKLNGQDNEVSGTATVNIANHGGWVSLYKVYTSPSLAIQLIDGPDGEKLLVSFLTATYKMNEVNSDKTVARTSEVKITDVYPFVQKSSYKISYARAYIGTYQYFWSFIKELRDELNKNFSQDTNLLSQLRYEHANDSLMAKYGEPTNVISHLSTTLDVNNEIRFYENAQKVVFMGKTIDFGDVISCKIDDDPQFIPGRTYTYGAGLSFFGIGIGGATTTSTPDKTIHNYVVKVKMDNLKIPFIYIATGQDEHKATEIQSSFEYIMRHQQGRKATAKKSTSRAATKKRR